MTSFPKEDRFSVTPSDIPHVPNAEVISNSRDATGTPGSETDNIIVAAKTIRIAKTNTAKAL